METQNYITTKKTLQSFVILLKKESFGGFEPLPNERKRMKKWEKPAPQHATSLKRHGGLSVSGGNPPKMKSSRSPHNEFEFPPPSLRE